MRILTPLPAALLALGACHHVNSGPFGGAFSGGPAPDVLGLARFQDLDGDGQAGPGDRVVLSFDAPITVNDPSVAGFELFVDEDSFGLNALVVGGPGPNEVAIVLGDDARLRTRGIFEELDLGPNAPSGVRIGDLAPDAIENTDTGKDVGSSGWLDIVPEPVPGTNTGLADTAQRVAGADLNLDGVADWAATAGDEGVDLYEGLETGGYLRLNLSVPDARVVRLFDLRGRGRHDIIVLTGGSIQTFENLSDPGSFLSVGTFQTLDLPFAVQDLAPIDADDDGDLDLALLAEDGVRLVRNDGSGILAPPELPLPLSPTDGLALDVGDVDRDGSADLLIARDGENVLIASDGCGEFGAPMSIPGAGSTDVIALGDIDRDGQLDAVGGGADGLAVWFGAEGTLVQGFELDGSPVAALALADLDGDEALDVLYGDPSALRVLSNLSGEGLAVTGIALAVEGIRDLAIGDVDRDGDLDLFVASELNPQVWDGSLRGSWGQARMRVSGDDVGSGPLFAVSAGDVDGDGDTDLLFGRNSSIEIHLNAGGSFDGPPVILDLMGSRAHGLTLADIDQDGDLDLVAAIIGEAARIWLNDGDAEFTPRATGGGFERATAVAVGDLDGDGDLDAVLGWLGSATDRILFNRGTDCAGGGDWLGFEPPMDLPGTAGTPDVALGDVDSDGDLDLLFAHGDGLSDRLFLNDGDGGFSLSGQTFGTRATRTVVFADLDLDGDLDLIAGKPQEDDVWHNDGTGMFTHVATLKRDNTYDQAVVDLNGDRIPDMIEARELSLGVVIYIGTPDGLFSDGPLRRKAGADVRRIQVIDVDRDGAPEFVTGMEDGSPNRLWRNL